MPTETDYSTDVQAYLIDMHKQHVELRVCDSFDDMPEMLTLGWLLNEADHMVLHYTMERLKGCVIVRDGNGLVFGGMYPTDDIRRFSAFCYFGG